MFLINDGAILKKPKKLPIKKWTRRFKRFAYSSHDDCIVYQLVVISR